MEEFAGRLVDSFVGVRAEEVALRLRQVLGQPPGADRVVVGEARAHGEARDALLNGINDGALLLNYLGHAGLDRLAQEKLFMTGDVAQLLNRERLPVMVAMTCSVGKFDIPGYDTLSEAMVLAENGGAIAVWSPTGYSYNTDAKLLDSYFLSALFENPGISLGNAVNHALKEYALLGRKWSFMKHIYNLLGDPAIVAGAQ